MEAVDKFLSENDGFVVDSRCERFLMTLNPRGLSEAKDIKGLIYANACQQRTIKVFYVLRQNEANTIDVFHYIHDRVSLAKVFDRLTAAGRR